jgi:hypothetical protein
MKTKNLLLMSVLVTVTTSAAFSAQQSESYYYGTEQFDPSKDVVQAEKSATDRVIGRLEKPTAASAGVDAKEFKSASKTCKPCSACMKSCDWIKDPVFYVDAGYQHIDDRRSFSMDGDKYLASAGVDFTTVGDILVGALYSYSAADKSLNNNSGFNLNQDSYAHTFTLYTGKNFFNWLNVGGTASYSNENLNLKNAFFNARTDKDNYSASAFAGVSHTFGNWSLASTPTYIYQDEYTDSGFAFSTGTASSGTLAILNRADYAVTEKLTLGVIANWTQLLHENVVRLPSDDRSWATFGARATYHYNAKLSVNAGYEAEVFNRIYDNHLVRLGMNYGF